jgi:MinD-like ATPase involved in chromosome partitioning or flagellar assembly
MLSLGLVTSNTIASEAIEQMAREAGIFDFTGNREPEVRTHEVIKTLRSHDPELILLDLSDWNLVGPLVEHIRGTTLRGKLIGFRTSWTRPEEIDFERAGITHLMREPFSPSDLEKAAHIVLHGATPAPRPNLLAFVPAKAGGGCSTTALNTAAALGGAPGKRVLVIEGDARSGAFSIMLNITNRLRLHNALERAGEMSMVEWQQMHVNAHGMDLLLADPSRPVPQSSWGDYFQLLKFAEKHYDSIVVDLPEIINDATAEVARAAGKVFVVCTPEILSLKLASLRCQQIQAYGVPRERVHVIVTRWQRDGISTEDVEESLGRPVYATLSNDYNEAQAAILESRLASPASAFGKDCRALARRINGEPEEVAQVSFRNATEAGS